MWAALPRLSEDYAGALLPAACALALLSVLMGARGSAEGVERNSARRHLDEHLDERLEQLKDAHWVISENEARLKAVLDAQKDIILRRDADGCLTFVNDAFARTFGVTAERVLGTPFEPEVLACESADGSSTPAAPGASVELVSTVSGPRWIAWQRQSVPGLTGGDEVQCAGYDVTDARQAALALKDARDQAEEANRAKSRFLAAMSHEIRTPMNGILGMASLLAETPLSADQETYVRAVDQSARNLVNLIDEILDFSRIEAGKLVLNPQPFSLSSTVQGVVELMAPAAEEKGLEIVWHVAPACAGLFLGDEARVRQILLNLVSNAVKFTDRGGIVVRIAPACHIHSALPQRIRLSIEDTGIGLSEADRVRVFAEFEQAEAAVQRRRGGTGLGLAISMSLARAMNGMITLESKLGHGSTFHVELELEPAAAEELEGSIDHEAASRLAVLMVSQRSIEQRTLAATLRERGISVIECTPQNAEAHIREASHRGAALNRLVIDGEFDPLEAGALLAALRATPGSADAAGIVLVGMMARSNLSQFRSAGYEGYLVRPVRPRSLLEQLGVLRTKEQRAWRVAADAAQGTSSEGEGRSAASQRVLLAEDNAVNALLATRMLEQAGCEVMLVKDGAKALEAMREVCAGRLPAFSLVLMDIHMPVLDGVEATRAMKDLFARTSSGLAAPPIVALTANAFAEDREHYLAAGMSDYMAKPFDTADLRQLLGRWLPPAGHPGRVSSAA